MDEVVCSRMAAIRFNLSGNRRQRCKKIWDPHGFVEQIALRGVAVLRLQASGLFEGFHAFHYNLLRQSMFHVGDCLYQSVALWVGYHHGAKAVGRPRTLRWSFALLK